MVLMVKNLPASAEDVKRREFDPRLGKIPWIRKWQPTPVFLPEESHRQKSLAGYSPQCRKESDTTEVMGFPGGTVVKNAGDVGSIPGLERSPAGGNGNLL